jgi:hypothetical protein
MVQRPSGGSVPPFFSAADVGCRRRRAFIEKEDRRHRLNQGVRVMCRNIKTLYNFSPPATEDEIRASALQFVRKISGFNRPSQANEAAFNRAVDQVTDAARELLGTLVTLAPPRDREVEAEKAKARNAARFGAG